MICSHHGVDYQPMCPVCDEFARAGIQATGRAGVKHDSGKPQLGLIPREALNHEAAAFAFGAKKYGKNNFKGGMDWSRLIDASLRHITAFASKEDIDKESNSHHLGNARACLAILLYYIENNVGNDNR